MVIRRMEIIGKAVKDLPENFLKTYSEIDWQDATDMRNVLIHAYFSIDLKVVWDTIKNDLPEFKKQLESLLELSEV